jgi:hypothetical protein
MAEAEPTREETLAELDLETDHAGVCTTPQKLRIVPSTMIYLRIWHRVLIFFSSTSLVDLHY